MKISATLMETGYSIDLDVSPEDSVAVLRRCACKCLEVLDCETFEVTLGGRLLTEEDETCLGTLGLNGDEELLVRALGQESYLLAPHEYPHSAPLSSVCLSSDGRLLYSGSENGDIKVFWTETGECEATLKGHTSEVTTILCDVANERLYSLSADSVRVWWVENLKSEKVIPGEYSAIALLDRQEQLIIAQHLKIQILDVGSWTSSHILKCAGTPTTLATSPKSDKLYCSKTYGGGDIGTSIWCTKTWNILADMEGDAPRKIVPSPDGTAYYCLMKTGKIKVCDASTHNTLGSIDVASAHKKKIAGYKGAPLEDFCVSSDGTTLLCVGQGVTLWDARTRRSGGRLKGASGVGAAMFNQYLCIASSSGVSIKVCGMVELENVSKASSRSSQGDYDKSGCGCVIC